MGQARAERDGPAVERGPRLKTEADVDRLLDEMGEGSSSDEEAVDVDVAARVRA